MVYYYFFSILFFIYNYLMFEHKHVVSRHFLFSKNIICARKLLGFADEIHSKYNFDYSGT